MHVIEPQRHRDTGTQGHKKARMNSWCYLCASVSLWLTKFIAVCFFCLVLSNINYLRFGLGCVVNSPLLSRSTESTSDMIVV